MKDLKTQIRNCTEEEFREIIDWLFSVRREKDDATLLKEFVDIMIGITGINCLEKGRAYPLPFLRYMVAEAMAKEGLSLSAISKAIGINHSTLSYGHLMLGQAVKMSIMYDKVNGLSLEEVWNEFMKRISDGKSD